MKKKYTLLTFLLFATFCIAQDSPAIKGAVSKPGAVDAKVLKGLNKYHRLVKIADARGNFVGSLEVRGYALRDVIDCFEVNKKDDGFDRPLDLVVTARNKSGDSVLFSHGEVFYTGDEGPLLVDAARMILPSRHEPLRTGKNDPTIALMDVNRRNTVNSVSLNSCNSCHDRLKVPKIYFPKGWLLVAAQDGFGGRYIEGVTEISVNQVGIKTLDTRSSGGRDSIVETPVIVGPDGKEYQFSLEEYRKLPRVSLTDAGIGHGKGYRGTSTWEGVPLKGLIQHLLPNGANPKNAYVLITAADGYRSTFSGTEVFTKSNEKCVLLIDRKDGDALGEGSGLYTIVQSTDFFVDRNVRMVKEIRLVVVE
ncbi:MAG: hypothetical protein FWG12_05125 [Holophagaceae bacterium]|nr:hypothetical protein [Holophagaceae bacterium]